MTYTAGEPFGMWATNATKTHCKRGHPFDEVNTYVNARGRRNCRECQRQHAKAYSDKNRTRTTTRGLLTIEDALSSFVPVPESGCWLWDGRAYDKGYGVVPLGARGKKDFAHRVFFRHHKGEIPDDMFVCHKCDTPACVNPDHLFLGTNEDNMRDRHRKGRYRAVSEANKRRAKSYKAADQAARIER